MSNDIEKRAAKITSEKLAAKARNSARAQFNQEKLETQALSKETASNHINKLASELQKHTTNYGFISIERPSRYKFTPADFRDSHGNKPEIEMPHLVLKATARPEECRHTVVFYNSEKNEYKLYQTKKSSFARGGSDPGSVKKYAHYYRHSGSFETTIDALKDIIAKSVAHERRPTKEKFNDASRVFMMKIPDIAFPIGVFIAISLMAKCSEAAELTEELQQNRHQIELNHTNKMHYTNTSSMDYLSPK